MMTLITINRVYYLIGFVVMLLVVMTLRDRANPKRYTTALFWFLFGGIFLFGDLMVQELGKSLAYRIIGGAVIVIALLAGFGLVGKGYYKMSTEEERVASSNRLKNWLFLPALMIPVVTVIGTLFLKGVSIGGVYLLDQKQLTLAALCVACVAAILTGWWLTKGTPLHAVRQSRRLVDTIGWAVILPQMLAMLGGVFVVANTGESVPSCFRRMSDFTQPARADDDRYRRSCGGDPQRNMNWPFICGQQNGHGGGAKTLPERAHNG